MQLVHSAMARTSLIFFFALWVLPTSTHNFTQPPEQHYVIIERMPEPIGGWGRVRRSVKYPEEAKNAKVEGKVVVQFIVDENGDVVDPVVLEGIGSGCDEAAIAAIQNVSFKPSTMQGKPVKVQLEHTVTFKLPGTNGEFRAEFM